MSNTATEKHYPKKKIDQINEIVELIENYEMIGISSLEGVSSNVLQNIRKTLRGDTEIKVAKNTLKRIALEQASKKKPQVKNLLEHINGNGAFIFSNRNPFALQKYFNSNRIPVAAKPGQIATEDVWVSAGPTEMSPGPVIGELNSIGIRTTVEAGKIKINQDTKVCSAGDVITETHASIFSKLSIKPLKMGIALHLAMEENGDILLEQDLTVDEQAILDDLKSAYVQAFNFSLSTAYPTSSTINPLISLATSYANNLSVSVSYPTKENISLLFSKAIGQATAISNLQ